MQAREHCCQGSAAHTRPPNTPAEDARLLCRVLPGRNYWRRDARHRCAPPNYAVCCGRSALWQQQRGGRAATWPPRGPIKEDKSTFFGKEGDQSHPCGNQPAVRRGGGAEATPLHAVEQSHRRRVEGGLAISRRSQREASPFTQFALTGCALLLVGLGLLQIFGTMVTASQGRDEEEAVMLIVAAVSRLSLRRGRGGGPPPRN